MNSLWALLCNTTRVRSKTARLLTRVLPRRCRLRARTSLLHPLPPSLRVTTESSTHPQLLRHSSRKRTPGRPSLLGSSRLSTLPSTPNALPTKVPTQRRAFIRMTHCSTKELRAQPQRSYNVRQALSSRRSHRTSSVRATVTRSPRRLSATSRGPWPFQSWNPTVRSQHLQTAAAVSLLPSVVSMGQAGRILGVARPQVQSYTTTPL